jgi:GNAT superfamily N-acetyltransferase
MFKIGLLADIPYIIPAVACVFEREWPDYWAARGEGEAERQLSTGVWLVALENDAPIGVVALRARPLPGADQLHLMPALTGLLVDPAHRCKGVGGKLIEAGANLAKARGDKRLYSTPVGAARLVERQGWRAVDTINMDGKPVRVFAVDL